MAKAPAGRTPAPPPKAATAKKPAAAKKPAPGKKAAGVVASAPKSQKRQAATVVSVKRAPGQPTLYRDEYAEWAMKLAKLGATDLELAEAFEVAEATVANWKNAHPEFLDSIKRGRRIADAEVASKLFHRATGYEHEEDDIKSVGGGIVITPTVKHYPPDTTAAIFWLKNRRPDLWRDKVENALTGPGGGAIAVQSTVTLVRPQERTEDDD